MRTILRTPAVAHHNGLPMRISIFTHLLNGIRNMRILQLVEPAQIEVGTRSHTPIRGMSVVVRHPHAVPFNHHTRATSQRSHMRAVVVRLAVRSQRLKRVIHMLIPPVIQIHRLHAVAASRIPESDVLKVDTDVDDGQ